MMKKMQSIGNDTVDWVVMELLPKTSMDAPRNCISKKILLKLIGVKDGIIHIASRVHTNTLNVI